MNVTISIYITKPLLYLNHLTTLYNLIHELTIEEKEFVNSKIEKLPGRKRNADYIKLYFAISKTPIFDEKQIVTRWIGQYDYSKSIRFFYEAQPILLDLLLELLHHHNPLNNAHIYERQILDADKLGSRGFFDAAFEYYSDVLNKLYVHDNPYLQATLIRKMYMLIPQLKSFDKKKELTKLIQLEKQIASEEQLFSEVYHLQLETGYKMSQSVVIKKEADKNILIETLNISILNDTRENISFTTYIYLAKVKTFIYRMLNDKEKAYQSQLKLVTKQREFYTLLLEQKPFLLYSELLDLSDLSWRTNRITEAFSLLDEVESILPKINDKKRKRYGAVLNTRCLIYYYHNQPYDGLKLIHELDLFCLKNKKEISDMHYPILLCTLIKCYLNFSNYSKVEFWHEKALTIKKGLRYDFHSIIHILYVLSLYEQCEVLINLVTIEVTEKLKIEVQLLKHFFRGKSIDIPFEKIITKHMIDLSGSRRCEEHIKILEHFLKSLEQLPRKGYIYQDHYYQIFDIRNWILQQMERVRYGKKKTVV
jgi:hypothetical protein